MGDGFLALLITRLFCYILWLYHRLVGPYLVFPIRSVCESLTTPTLLHSLPPVNDDEFWTPPTEPAECDPKGPTGKDWAEEDRAAWSGLASFVGDLIQLHVVVYACEDQVPVTILQALYIYSGRPCLHVYRSA